MDTNASREIDETFKSQLQDCANQLAEKLQTNQIDDASELIHQLVEVKNSHIFNSVGQLTRGLHDAIVNFHVDSEVEQRVASSNPEEMSDASDRLQYVIDITRNAADKTMDKVEAVAPIARNLGEESTKLRDDWVKLKRREISKDEFKSLYNRVDNFLEQMDSGTQQLNTGLNEIILEQSFQDLTGQVLNRVIELIRNVETELVDLMRIACQVEEVAGLANEVEQGSPPEQTNCKAEGPQIHADKRDDVVSNQDEVDDLLSSLGF